MDRDVVQIDLTLRQHGNVGHPAALYLVLHHSRRIAFIVMCAGLLRTTNLPDVARFVLYAVQAREKACFAKHMLDLPGLGIDLHQTSQAIGGEPQLAVFPGVAMRSATILRRAKWNLTPADLLTGLDVGLEHAGARRVGVGELRRARP